MRKFLTSYLRSYLSLAIEFQLRMRALNSFCKYIEDNMIEVTIAGYYCEFGVYKGDSVNYIARQLDQKVNAFDSFEGLPEIWLSTHKKGHFSLKRMPTFEKKILLSIKVGLMKHYQNGLKKIQKTLLFYILTVIYTLLQKLS